MKDINLISLLKETGALTYSFDPKNEYIEETQVLVQKIIKKILTLKGSNKFDATLGSNFFNLFNTIDLKSVETVKGIFPVLLKDITKQIKLEQVSFNESLSASEMLEDLVLDDIVFDDIILG